MKVQIAGDLIATYNTYDDYMARPLPVDPYQTVIYVATNDAVCQIRQDFYYARDNGLFPVKAYQLKRIIQEDN